MGRRIQVTVDSSVAEDAAIVTLTLKDGRTYTKTVEHATGAPANPMTDAQLEDKFRGLAEDVLPRRRCNRILDLLWNLDKVDDIREVVALLRVRHRSVRG